MAPETHNPGGHRSAAGYSTDLQTPRAGASPSMALPDSVSVLDAAMLETCITSLQDSREEDVLQRLRKADAPGCGSRLPHVVSLRAEFNIKGSRPSAEVTVLASDLMLTTDVSELRLSTLEDNLLLVPMVDDFTGAQTDKFTHAGRHQQAQEALTFVAQVLRNKRHWKLECSGKCLPQVIETLNFLCAESVLAGAY